MTKKAAPKTPAEVRKAATKTATKPRKAAPAMSSNAGAATPSATLPPLLADVLAAMADGAVAEVAALAKRLGVDTKNVRGARRARPGLVPAGRAGASAPLGPRDRWCRR